MPTGLSWSCSPLVICSSSASAPRTTSLAGALWTPRVSSLRAQTPAMWPLGGTKRRCAAERVEDLDPRPVERGVLGVVAGLVDPPLLDLLGVEAGRRVEDGDPVAHQLAVGDHRQLDRLDPLEVDDALLVDGHQVRDSEHRDVVDRFEAAEAGAVGRVADVVVRTDANGRAGASAPARAMRPAAGTRSAMATLPTSSIWMSFDCALTIVTTFCLPLAGRNVVEGLLDLAGALDDELERVLLGRVGLGDLDGQVVAAGPGLDGPDAVAGESLACCGLELGLRGGHRTVGADADDVARAAAVEEVAVDGVREVGALDEVTELVRELTPVGDEGRLVRLRRARRARRTRRRPCRRPRSDVSRPRPPRRRHLGDR